MRYWMTLDFEEPKWAKISHPPIDFQDIYYYSSPIRQKRPESMDEVDPELLAAFNKLGIPLDEQKKLSGVAVDAVFDSVSVATTLQKTLEDAGVQGRGRRVVQIYAFSHRSQRSTGLLGGQGEI